MTAPVPAAGLFFGKLAVLLLITLLTQLWMEVLFLISGKMAGLPGLCPPSILLWLLRGTIGALPICCLQLFLSMNIRSFSIPIGIALLGSVAGVLINNEGKGLFWPYSLMLLGMNANGSNKTLTEGYLPFIFSALLQYGSLITGISKPDLVTVLCVHSNEPKFIPDCLRQWHFPLDRRQNIF